MHRTSTMMSGMSLHPYPRAQGCSHRVSNFHNLGPILKPVLVPFLGPALGPHDFVFNSWAPKRYLKIFRGANFVGRHRQGSCRYDLQSVVCSAILFNCLQQTKNFRPRRNGKLGRRICSNKEHVYVCRRNTVKT